MTAGRAGLLDGRLRADAAERGPADVLLEALELLAGNHVPDGHEGPGSLVDAGTWRDAVRALADQLLAPAVGPDGLVHVHRASPLYPESPERPGELHLPAPTPPWQGRLVVVVGCGRSGTTWLERLLMASPLAGGVDGAESFLFHALNPLWRALPAAAPLCDRARLAAALRTFTDRVLQDSLARHSPGATHFIEKTPLHALLLPEVHAVYPDAAYVHVVRDGREVARSMSQVPFFLLPDPADAARTWRRVLETVRRDAEPIERFREVRYEDLVADPVARTRELLDWLGLPADDEELRSRAVTRVSTHAGTAHAVGASSWTTLPPRDRHRVQAECGKLLVAEGYQSAAELRRSVTSPSYLLRRAARARWLRG